MCTYSYDTCVSTGRHPAHPVSCADSSSYQSGTSSVVTELKLRDASSVVTKLKVRHRDTEYIAVRRGSIKQYSQRRTMQCHVITLHTAGTTYAHQQPQVHRKKETQEGKKKRKKKERKRIPGTWYPEEILRVERKDHGSMYYQGCG